MLIALRHVVAVQCLNLDCEQKDGHIKHQAELLGNLIGKNLEYALDIKLPTALFGDRTWCPNSFLDAVILAMHLKSGRYNCEHRYNARSIGVRYKYARNH